MFQLFYKFVVASKLLPAMLITCTSWERNLSFCGVRGSATQRFHFQRLPAPIASRLHQVAGFREAKAHCLHHNRSGRRRRIWFPDDRPPIRSRSPSKAGMMTSKPLLNNASLNGPDRLRVGLVTSDKFFFTLLLSSFPLSGKLVSLFRCFVICPQWRTLNLQAVLSANRHRKASLSLRFNSSRERALSSSPARLLPASRWRGHFFRCSRPPPISFCSCILDLLVPSGH